VPARPAGSPEWRLELWTGSGISTSSEHGALGSFSARCRMRSPCLAAVKSDFLSRIVEVGGEAGRALDAFPAATSRLRCSGSDACDRDAPARVASSGGRSFKPTRKVDAVGLNGALMSRLARAGAYADVGSAARRSRRSPWHGAQCFVAFF